MNELDQNMLVGNFKDVTYECWWKLLQQLFKLFCNVKWSLFLDFQTIVFGFLNSIIYESCY